MLNDIYDVAIIGGGIGGLMSAYMLSTRAKKNNLKLNIIIIDKGKKITERKCPAKYGVPCTHCKVCSITSGLSGAGAFSDGKFNLGTSYGGTLGDELGETTAMEYITLADNILQNIALKNNISYPKTYGTSMALRLKCLQNNLRLLDMTVRHLGTDRNLELMSKLIEELENNGVKFLTETEVEKIEVKSVNTILTDYVYDEEPEIIQEIYINHKGEKNILTSNKTIIAVGRGGSEFFKKFCDENGIMLSSNAVDIGVRVEMKDDIWKEFSDKIYEPKIVYKTKTFEDKTRMFCFNQGGLVSAENNDGVITANGHSYSDKNMKTDNCNFAILTSINFTKPFDEPTVYAKNISALSNIIGGGNVIVQRFGDLIRGRRTTDKRLSENTVRPTLKATAGDLSLVLPHRILTDIVETIYALDKVAPGTANDDTLLYGVESKYYSLRPFMLNDFSIVENVYVVGDCSGICRGLSQSAAMGLYVGEQIFNKG